MQRLLAGLLLVLLVPVSVTGTPPIPVGHQKQVFLDGLLVARAQGVQMVVHSPRKTGEILLKADKPWETAIGAFASILQDDEDGLIKLWYEVEDYNRDLALICYATSRDGVHWNKPLLGLHKDSRGSTKNNIVFAGTAFAKKTRVVGGTVMKDPKAKREERYRFFWLALGAHSPDGLHWTRYPKSLFRGIAADTHPVVFYDDRIGRYVAYSRHNVWQPCPPEESRRYTQAVRVRGKQILRRRVMRSESEDGVNWDEFQPVLVPGDMPDQRAYDFYNSGALKYAWAERAYFLQTSRYHYARNSLDVQLAVSRDGIHWKRPTKRPFLPLGKSGAFDARGVFVCSGIVRHKDQLSIYYTGENVGHGSAYVRSLRSGGRGYSISRAVLRLDGFTSMNARSREGTLTTVPLVFDGDRMELNARMKDGGGIVVAILDADDSGKTLGLSQMVTGDDVASTVTWKQDPNWEAISGRPVVLQFKMKEAQLYAFQFLRKTRK